MFEKNIELSKYSNYKIGGPAKFFCAPKTTKELESAVLEAKKNGLRIFILGGGTNLLISDKGFDGLVIKPDFSEIGFADKDRAVVRVGAGVLVSKFLDFCVKESLSGFEWAGGLPGTVGGAIWGNAGAFGGETKDRVEEVLSMDISKDEPVLVKRKGLDCAFGYRTSIFKQKAFGGEVEVILESLVSLERGDREEIKKLIDEKIKYRLERQPLEYPNIGSIFKNNPWEKVPPEVRKRFEKKFKEDPIPVLPTAVLIDAAGLKGRSVGGAKVSEKHPNFIINFNKATAADVKSLMDIVRLEVKERFGVELEQEVMFV